MPGRNNWIVLLAGGVLMLSIGILGLVAGGGSPVPWLYMGVGFGVGSFVLRRISRRDEREIMRAIEEDERRGSAS